MRIFMISINERTMSRHWFFWDNENRSYWTGSDTYTNIHNNTSSQKKRESSDTITIVPWWRHRPCRSSTTRAAAAHNKHTHKHTVLNTLMTSTNIHVIRSQRHVLFGTLMTSSSVLVKYCAGSCWTGSSGCTWSSITANLSFMYTGSATAPHSNYTQKKICVRF